MNAQITSIASEIFSGIEKSQSLLGLNLNREEIVELVSERLCMISVEFKSLTPIQRREFFLKTI